MEVNSVREQCDTSLELVRILVKVAEGPDFLRSYLRCFDARIEYAF